MNKETHLLLGARGTPKVHEKCEWINQDVLEELDAKSGSLGAQKRKATFVTELYRHDLIILPWRRKSVYDSLPFMPVRSCKVTIEDMNGVSHTVDVTAETLYEAVALGMAAIRTDDWVNGIAEGLNPVKVRVTNVPVEHEVRLMDFTKWLDRTGGSLREISDRTRIKSILGMRD